MRLQDATTVLDDLINDPDIEHAEYNRKRVSLDRMRLVRRLISEPLPPNTEIERSRADM